MTIGTRSRRQDLHFKLLNKIFRSANLEIIAVYISIYIYITEINIGSSFQPETRPDRVSGPDLDPDPTANWTRTRPEPDSHFSDPKPDPKPEMSKNSYPKMDPKINLPYHFLRKIRLFDKKIGQS